MRTEVRGSHERFRSACVRRPRARARSRDARFARHWVHEAVSQFRALVDRRADDGLELVACEHWGAFGRRRWHHVAPTRQFVSADAGVANDDPRVAFGTETIALLSVVASRIASRASAIAREAREEGLPSFASVNRYRRDVMDTDLRRYCGRLRAPRPRSSVRPMHATAATSLYCSSSRLTSTGSSAMTQVTTADKSALACRLLTSGDVLVQLGRPRGAASRTTRPTALSTVE